MSAVALLIIMLDQVSKGWALRSLTPGVPVDVLGGWLQLDLVRNSGAAFSMGAGFTIILTVVAIGVIVVVARFSARIESLWWALALGGLLGGSLGNLADRMFRPPAALRGHVIDFIELPHWPVFNVADMAIVGSVAMVVVLMWRGVPFGAVDSSGESSGSAS